MHQAHIMKHIPTFSKYFKKTFPFNKLKKVTRKVFKKTHNTFENQISTIITHGPLPPQKKSSDSYVQPYI